MKSIFFFIVSFSISFSCFSQAGSLDQSFGEGGKVYTNVIGQCNAVALQPDGKILAGGDVEDTFTLIRYLPDGSLDNSFGVNGIVYLFYGRVYTLFVLTDKSILASGPGASVFKFKENGSLDSSFGVNGVAGTVVGGIKSMQVQPDGKIVLAGYIFEKDNSLSMLLERLNANGSIDEDFGKNGKMVDESGYSFTCLALQQDGKIVAGGHNWRPGAGNRDEFVVNRYNPDGSPDKSFGANGKVFTDVSNENDVPYDMEILNDETILVAGTEKESNFGLQSYIAVVKYNNNGTLYETFGENGITHIIFQDRAAFARGLVLQPDGKMIVTGYVTPNVGVGPGDFALARLNNDGTFDSSFGINGEVITDFGESEYSNASSLQPNGKIIMAGNVDYSHVYLLARYNNDEVMPLHFTYFNAAPTNNGGIVLNWQTAQENNNTYFAVERTAGNDFSEIAKINSKGNSSQAQTYSYTDNAPLQGTNFYRLKQVDKDGKFSYSQIVSATVQNGLTVVLYPNPLKDVLHIKGLNAGMSYELSVMSVKGSIVAQTSISNNSSYNWNLQSLSNGVYYLSVASTNNEKTMVKFVKE